MLKPPQNSDKYFKKSPTKQELSMKVALASDERTSLTDFLVRDLERRGHEVLGFGAVAEGDTEVDWPLSVP